MLHHVSSNTEDMVKRSYYAYKRAEEQIDTQHHDTSAHGLESTYNAHRMLLDPVRSIEVTYTHDKVIDAAHDTHDAHDLKCGYNDPHDVLRAELAC